MLYSLWSSSRPSALNKSQSIALRLYPYTLFLIPLVLQRTCAWKYSSSSREMLYTLAAAGLINISPGFEARLNWQGGFASRLLANRRARRLPLHTLQRMHMHKADRPMRSAADRRREREQESRSIYTRFSLAARDISMQDSRSLSVHTDFLAAAATGSILPPSSRRLWGKIYRGHVEKPRKESLPLLYAAQSFSLSAESEDRFRRAAQVLSFVPLQHPPPSPSAPMPPVFLRASSRILRIFAIDCFA